LLSSSSPSAYPSSRPGRKKKKREEGGKSTKILCLFPLLTPAFRLRKRKKRGGKEGKGGSIHGDLSSLSSITSLNPFDRLRGGEKKRGGKGKRGKIDMLALYSPLQEEGGKRGRKRRSLLRRDTSLTSACREKKERGKRSARCAVSFGRLGDRPREREEGKGKRQGKSSRRYFNTF